MSSLLLHTLVSVFAALLAGAALPVFAQDSSGVYTTSVGGQKFGAETYTIKTNADGSRRAEAEATFGGVRLKAVTDVRADGKPAAFALEANGAAATRLEFTDAGAKVSAAGQPEKTIEARPDALFENGLWHHFIFLLPQYDAARGGAQEFSALLSTQALAFRLTLERDAAPAFDMKGKKVQTEHYRATTSLGLGFELWADPATRTPLLIAVPAQSVQVVRQGAEDLAAVVFAPKPAAVPSPNDPYTSEEATFSNGAQRLAGTLTVPKAGSAPRPAVLIITGSGAQDRDGTGVADIYRRVAETLSSAGFAVLRVDDRGAGKSAVPTTAASYRDLVNDSRAAFEYLLTRGEIDKTRVALVGHSEGAGTALLLAAEDPRVAGVALLAGASEPVDRVLVEQSLFQSASAGPIDPADRTKFSTVAQQLAKLFEQARAEPKPAAGAEDKLAWFREHIEFDPLAAARKVRVPALVVNGANDALVLPHHAIKIARAMAEAGNRRVTLRILPGLTHLFTQASGDKAGEVSPELLNTLRDWMKKEMGAKQ
jgi:uncharacterized protein